MLQICRMYSFLTVVYRNAVKKICQKMVNFTVLRNVADVIKNNPQF